jgi:hypothetical protein
VSRVSLSGHMISNDCSGSYAADDPGGQFQFPVPIADVLLYLTVQPHYTIFLESDESGSFIVNAPLSHIFGELPGGHSYETSADLSRPTL